MEKVILIDNNKPPNLEQKWEPLEELIGSKNCSKFSYVGASTLVDKTIVHCYRHKIMEFYLHISEDGRLWKYYYPSQGYIEINIDRKRIRDLILAGGNPSLKNCVEDNSMVEIVGYLFRGIIYCSNCISGISGVSEGEEILYPLYSSEKAKIKHCYLCNEEVRGGLRTNESIEEAERDNRFHEVENDVLQCK